jgi:hypothetical protein
MLDALAHIAALVAIALSTASCAPVDAPEGTAARPKLPSSSKDIDFDGRVAAAVEDFAGVDIDDGCHSGLPGELVRRALNRYFPRWQSVHSLSTNGI